MSDPAVALNRLLEIMAALRNPQSGCPWDLQQDFASIAPHTLEEVYEVIDAIEQGSLEQLEAELGDLLFQIVFYAQLGRESGDFDFATIAEGIAHKLLHRHPHVFPYGSVDSAANKPEIGADQVSANWEQIKQEERQRKQRGPVSRLDDVPHALPALLRSAKLQKRAATAGFDWKDHTGVLAKLHEELGELQEAIESGRQQDIAEEYGDLLFCMVNLARHLRVNPESALRAANRKFESRFRAAETMARADHVDLSELDAAAVDAYWRRAKAGEC
ncbi:MAG: nucleoside triphosphate pyrophosphohydrolase [Pseudohongiellaceae bacterium]